MLMLLLITKHLIADFFLQPPYQWKNKGTYGHPGGILHSSIHGIFTFLILIIFVEIKLAAILGVIDLVVHYHIDYFKMNINKKYGWTADTERFWYALGVDQYLHYLTYLGIAWIAGTT